ncbi:MULTISPECIES: cytochrome c oxidase subunit II [Brevibacillus]|jgi:cytochrome c oxidase subunit 2|uniref:Cytochrome aa3 subunit 2 n=1 Tax=Brevibacillus borstelensis AK1 TaxID=1300222 RepID=M8DWP2_9BACL|nr:cytochrome c oxidase subunit II [Brevibacillus borstelensis]EMT51436.1 bo3-type cytochrome c oxidase [Brevibacillus borstelensis AK1]KKX54957.1 cytochrome C oxidase subunit II [Brevibacillus borstelensis cifa_chp40]MCC0564394.1 cytochrome c oxidase subunit II [Brevibacillus borstelensis]MED1743812.1 cytochrome c oxidase subunit II [Brevibacillus borstelensis]MED1851614.1 cytochrome c oxidase subunit II [Brevibacillus borstelensis]
MHLHRYEKIWLSLGAGGLALFIVLLCVNAFAMGMAPPSNMEMIDPAKVTETPPFDNPGLKKLSDNEYDAYMTAFAFGFAPNKMEVPVGSKVNFHVTSPDVVHGFQIPGTNVNFMVMPGHINSASYTFDKPGEYLILCNEYCGAGHQVMATTIIVK